ncbi:MAG: FmdB family zinc ribbon protein [Thermodesulfobacteriota bacterium]
MPIYEYRCEDCQQIFEEWQKDFEERQMPCPVCGGNSKRLISNTSFILKGGGWYATDYAHGSAQANGNGSKSTEASSESDASSSTGSEKTQQTQNSGSGTPSAPESSSS